MEGIALVLTLFGLGILCAIAMGIGALIGSIQDKIEKKKRNKLIADYPELMPLIREYMRTQNNVAYTVKKQYELKEEINKRFSELEANSVGVWKNEFVQWMRQEGISKATKSNIRAFFKSRNIKVSVMTIDKIKDLLD